MPALNGDWPVILSMRFRDFTAMGPCVVFPCGAMWKGPEVNLSKGISCMIFHFFPGWWKIYLTYFCFLGSDDWNQIQFCRCGMIQENTKTWCATPQQLKMHLFHLQVNETYDTYLSMQIGSVQNLLQFSALISLWDLLPKKTFDLPPKGIVFSFC